jgi:hypothetical protein
MLRFLKTKTFLVGSIVLGLIGLYALAGFVLAPRLVRSALLKDIPETLGVTPAVGDIHINPFLFQVTVNNFSLTGAGGQKLLGFDRLFVDFDLSSIWHRAYSFGNIDITSPFVGAAVASDGSLNLMQLQPKPAKAEAKPAEKSSSLPAIRIGSFKVTQGLVTYEDRSRPDVFVARLEPINFELREFTTGVQGGRFTFTGESKLGEKIEWHGHVSVQPIESDGEFRIDGLQVHTLWEYLEDQLNFMVNSGRIDVEATYKFSAGNGTGGPAGLVVDVSKAALSDLAIRPKDSETDWLTVPSLTVTGTTVDLAKRQAHVDLVALTGLKVLSWMEPDGSINLMKLAATPTLSHQAASTAAGTAAPGGVVSAPAVPAAADSATSAAAGASSDATSASVTPNGAAAAPTMTTNNAAAAPVAPWQFDLRQFDLRDADISVEDRSTRPAVKVSLAPLSLQVNGASQDSAKPVTVTLDTHINGKGSLTASGEVTPQPVAANLSVKLADIDLAAIQPYIAQHTSMTLLAGRLGADTKVHYGTQQNGPAIQLAGDIRVEKLHTVDNVLQDDFVNWDRLDILGLNLTQRPDRLDIEQVVVGKPYARVIIESDESLNVKRVLAGPGATSTAKPDSAAAASGASPGAASATSTSASLRGKAADGKAKGTQLAKVQSGSTRATGGAEDAGAAAKPGRGAASNGAPSMPVSIKKVLVRAGQANFSDLSVQPNFSTGIQKLEGSITGLSSKPTSRATVDLHGSVDAFSPVSIIGEFNVLGPQLYTDIALGFHNIELSVFNPYSGKFAGYNISKGKLNTDLHYKVDGRKLDAEHHIVIEQLEFGDKTASKDAVSLPIKLAVALLKDRNGVIDLSVPVTGSLDDPQFRLAPIIWKVFVNILEKAVTAPFALLGSLFGGGPDIQYIDFQPGSSALDAAASAKAQTVAKGLVERPQLKIEVPIGVVEAVDGPALVATRFNAEVATAQAAKGGSKKAAAPTPVAYEQLDPATQLELLTQVYVKDFGGEPKFPDTVTGLKTKPEIAAAKIDFLDKAVRGHIQVGESEFQALGQQRAMAVQRVLLADSQVTPERVFLVANDKATSKDGAIRLELSLK